MDNKTVFKDLLVLELASVLAGPAVGMFFAELGAKVIKVENKSRGGDVTRSWKLPQEDSEAAYSAYYQSVNWGKEKLMLDLAKAADRNKILPLIEKADIVISNFKSTSAEKLGMDYDSIKALNPKVIYGAITAYGDTDERPGFDALIQAETGWIYMTGEKDGNPVKLPVALVDVLAAHQLKQGLLVALLKRAQSGKGSSVSVSLFDASVAALTNQASNWLNAGVLPQRMGSQHPNIAPYGDIFQTADEKLILVSTGTQKQFENLCDCLELPDLKSDPLFKTNSLRVANRSEMNKYLSKAVLRKNYTDLKKACDAQQVPIASINNMEDVFNIPMAQNLILEEKQSDGSTAKSVRTAVFKIKNS